MGRGPLAHARAQLVTSLPAPLRRLSWVVLLEAIVPLAAGLAAALAVIAATLPLLGRITTPASVRFE